MPNAAMLRTEVRGFAALFTSCWHLCSMYNDTERTITPDHISQEASLRHDELKRWSSRITVELEALSEFLGDVSLLPLSIHRRPHRRLAEYLADVVHGRW